MLRALHAKRHRMRRLGWPRAAVPRRGGGADDGRVATARLILRVAAAGGGRPAAARAGPAGRIAMAIPPAAAGRGSGVARP